uniref:Uncharacterized protein n=1 Tax=Chaetoceros debilis TaxID=122233 RepID=A0A7S3VHB0_9STRA
MSFQFVLFAYKVQISIPLITFRKLFTLPACLKVIMIHIITFFTRFFSSFLMLHPVLSMMPLNEHAWKMTDRFSGFRFEIRVPATFETSGINTPQFSRSRTIDRIVAKADTLFCFGWVQETNKDTLVGEARCTTQNGWKFKRDLVDLELSLPHDPTTNNDPHNKKTTDREQLITIKDYNDTKIKLHFSHFKVLDPGRETCFNDEPHQCENLLVPMW